MRISLVPCTSFLHLLQITLRKHISFIYPTMTRFAISKTEENLTITRTLQIPFPSNHLATTAHRALSVDAELSPLVRRSFALTTPSNTNLLSTQPSPSEKTILQVNYAATTNRMLRVAVNGFIESVGVVIGVMKDLDVDVVYEPVVEGLQGVQGLDGTKVG